VDRQDAHPRRAYTVAATAAFVVAVWTLQYLASPGSAAADISDVLATALTIVTIVLCARAARRLRSTAWWYIAIAGAAWIAADVIRLAEEAVHGEIVFPAVADAAYLVGIPPLLMGAWQLGHGGSSPRERLRSLFDGLLIGTSVVLVLWWVALGVIRAQELGALGTTILLLYVLGDVLVVTTIQSSRQIADPRRADLRLLSAAFVVLALADGTFAYGLATGSYRDGLLPSLGWMAGSAIVCWAAILAQRPGEHEHRRRIRDVYLYGSIAVGVAVTITSLVIDGALSAIQGWGLVALAVIGIARHAVSQHETDELRVQLEEKIGALSRSEARFRRVFNGIADGVAVVSADASLTAVNTTLAELLEQPAETLVGRLATDFLQPAEADNLVAAATAAGGELQLVTTVLRAESGRVVPVETTVSNLADDPSVRGFVVTVRDITERLRRQRELSESKERFRRSFEAAPIGMALIASSGAILEANDAYARMLGRSVDALVGHEVLDFTHPDDAELDRRRVAEMVTSGATRMQWEKRYVHADGHHVWVSLTISIVHLPNGDFELINQVEDITERRAALAQLAHNARHDILTGIPNRAYFEEQLAIALERAASTDTRIAVAFLDVDRFKVVNDNLGHRYGDELLRVVASRLNDATRGGDLVARFGGDEFTAMFCNVRDETVALTIAQRLIDRVCRPIELDDGEETFVSLSVGLALSVPSMDATAVDLMLSNADAAMYRAKEAGRDRIELHEAQNERPSVNRLRLANDLHRALERNELLLHYQPIVQVDTGAINAAEALLRWDHGTHGMVLPGEFVHLAEDTGLMVPIGAWTIGSVCYQLTRWNTANGRTREQPGALRASINLSSRQLDTGDVPTTVAAVIAETGIDPDWLWFEITESTLMRETTEAIATMRRLRDLGVHLAIDDFGTGYSSLAYLRRFPVEALKIDRSFVAGLGAKDEDTTIVRAVVELAHALGLQAVAEGVETEAQHEGLREIGCDLAQGWYFGVPAAPEEVADPWARDSWPGVSEPATPR
jgi:diguanylate cyclase (GGDEF)-like protein/PAS domain S-box-containing protein